MKRLLSLAVCLSVLLVSAFGVSAAPATDTVPAGQADAAIPAFFDGVEKYGGQMSDYLLKRDMGMGKVAAAIKSGCKYLNIYEMPDGSFQVAEVVSEVGWVYRPVADISAIQDSDYVDAGTGYEYMEYLADYGQGKIHVVLQDSGKAFYLGSFNKEEDLELKDISYDVTPVADVVVSGDNKVKTITVKYRLPEKAAKYENNETQIRFIYLVQDGKILQSKDALADTDYVTFDVTNNGDYVVEVKSYSATAKVDVKVEGIEDASSIPPAEAKDTKPPAVTFGEFPSEAVEGSTIELVMYSLEPAMLVFNGQSSSDYVTEMRVTVSRNAGYSWSAVDKEGNTSSGVLDISFFKVLETAFDRDGMWGTPVDNVLPQTGGVSTPMVAVSLGLLISLLGAALYAKQKHF